MSIRRIACLSLVISCFGLSPALIAGQSVSEAHRNANAAIGAELERVKQACGTDEKCLPQVHELDSAFSKFRTQNFDTQAHLNAEKQRLLEMAKAIKPGSVENQEDQKRADLISRVKASVDQAKNAV